MTTLEIWTYRESEWVTGQFVGFSVEALDGGIGKVDEVSQEVGAGYLVVDTGPWIFGKKVLLPAGVIDRIDFDEEKIVVFRTKDEIKNSPEFDQDRYRDESYRNEIGGYYGPGGLGYRANR